MVDLTTITAIMMVVMAENLGSLADELASCLDIATNKVDEASGPAAVARPCTTHPAPFACLVPPGNSTLVACTPID